MPAQRNAAICFGKRQRIIHLVGFSGQSHNIRFVPYIRAAYVQHSKHICKHAHADKRTTARRGPRNRCCCVYIGSTKSHTTFTLTYSHTHETPKRKSTRTVFITFDVDGARKVATFPTTTTTTTPPPRK